MQIITRSFPKYDLPAVARISSRLRDLAERRLYHTIHHPYLPEDSDERHLQDQNLWPLYRTVFTRRDLVEKIKYVDLAVTNRAQTVDIPTSSILLGGLPFATSEVSVKMDEAAMAGALLQCATNVEHLILHVCSPSFKGLHIRSGSENKLARECMGRLFTGFNAKTAHLV